MLQIIDKPECDLKYIKGKSGYKQTFSGRFTYDAFWEKNPVNKDYPRYFEKITSEKTGKVTWFENF